MKKLVLGIIGLMLFASCTKDIKTNDPAFQAQFGDALWRANDARVSLGAGGEFQITAYTEFEELTLSTSASNIGTYTLGTTNESNYATYTFDSGSIFGNYETTSSAIGNVNKVSGMINQGTGYSNNGTAVVTGGSGSGMVLVLNSTNGEVTYVSMLDKGTGYQEGDVLTIFAGNADATIRVVGISPSTGLVNSIEIVSGGSGYTSIGNGALTSTDGSGSGLRLATVTTAGKVTKVYVVSRGDGYKAGDLITIEGGNNNATLRVLNVQQSNGEIIIESINNGRYTGSFKFTAVDENGEVVTFSEGVFYNIPVY